MVTDDGGFQPWESFPFHFVSAVCTETYCAGNDSGSSQRVGRLENSQCSKRIRAGNVVRAGIKKREAGHKYMIDLLLTEGNSCDNGPETAYH